MIDVKEHVYADDPACGHPDVRTRLKNVSYFFLGNGLIQGAVQVAPRGEGTPVGLLLMNPESLRKKREALTFSARSGLEKTMVTLASSGMLHRPCGSSLQAAWSREHSIPVVNVRWKAPGFTVGENFFCPSRTEPIILREVRVMNTGNRRARVVVQTGIVGRILKEEFFLGPKEEKKFFFRYRLRASQKKVSLDNVTEGTVDDSLFSYWNEQADILFSHPILDHFFRVSQSQLPAVISRSGRVDGSVWQYNREWLRDQAMLSIGLTLAGNHGLARLLLDRAFRKFVTEEGDTIDSSERRDPDEVELDQNGALLHALKNYVHWTGDLRIIDRNWEKIVKTAEFPLKKIFRHEPSGLLANQREFWERHRAHGILKGMELMHQFFASLGLSSAAALASLIGRKREAQRWDQEAQRLRHIAFLNRCPGFVTRRGLIKRRLVDGSIQERIRPLPESGLPQKSPLASPGAHFLNPDSSCALPIAMGFVPANSPLARATLSRLETLWNQWWKGGGYGRYHASSEPDSPGPWPFASLFIARASLEAEDFSNVWRILNWLNAVPGAQSGSWFEFYGPRLAPPFPQVGIIPWTWAEIIVLLVHHILGVQPSVEGLRIKPQLLPGMGRVKASLPLRKGRLDLDIQRASKGGRRGFDSNVPFVQISERNVLVPYKLDNFWVKALI